jgi:CHASE1-domain containing sensor protein
MKKDDDKMDGLAFVIIVLLALWGVGILCAITVVAKALGI